MCSFDLLIAWSYENTPIPGASILANQGFPVSLIHSSGGFVPNSWDCDETTVDEYHLRSSLQSDLGEPTWFRASGYGASIEVLASPSATSQPCDVPYRQ
jgi:hypothetical protein